MNFPEALLKGRLIKRYKRFLADIELENGPSITAHCPNPGAMLGIKAPGIPVWVSRSSNLARKLPYTWEMTKVEGTFVGVNTTLPNTLVEEAITAKFISEFTSFSSLKREVRYGENSRIDLLLERKSGQRVYIEVKNVHLKRNDSALFPDSVTIRGAKHMRELANIIKNRHEAYVMYVVQRDDCKSCALAKDIDPTYSQESDKAFDIGVKPLVYACEVNPNGIKLSQRLTFNR